ncbi:MAG: hypothetical protein AB1489_39265 [Acidobacteriota bacterium]
MTIIDLMIQTGMTNRDVLRLVGFGLTALASVSGVALFFLSLGSKKDHDKSTLWGLFIIGMLVGLIIIAATG